MPQDKSQSSLISWKAFHDLSDPVYHFMLDLHPTAGCFSPGSPCSRVPSAYRSSPPVTPSFSANFHIPLNTEIRRNLLWEASPDTPPRISPRRHRDLFRSPTTLVLSSAAAVTILSYKGCLCPFHQIGSKFPQDRNHPGHRHLEGTVMASVLLPSKGVLSAELMRGWDILGARHWLL